MQATQKYGPWPQHNSQTITWLQVAEKTMDNHMVLMLTQATNTNKGYGCSRASDPGLAFCSSPSLHFTTASVAAKAAEISVSHPLAGPTEINTAAVQTSDICRAFDGDVGHGCQYRSQLQEYLSQTQTWPLVAA